MVFSFMYVQPALSDFDETIEESAPPRKPSAVPSKEHEKDSPHFIDFSTSSRTVSAPPGSLLSGTSLAHTCQLPNADSNKNASNKRTTEQSNPPDYFEPHRSVSSYAILEEGSSVNTTPPSQPDLLEAPPTRNPSDAPQNLSSRSLSQGPPDISENQPLLSSSGPQRSLSPPLSPTPEDPHQSASSTTTVTSDSSQNVATPVPSEKPPSGSAPAPSPRVDSSQQAISRAPSLGTCVICMDSEITHVVVPCGHACMCEPCSVRMRYVSQMCPICRRRMRKISRLVFPPSNSL